MDNIADLQARIDDALEAYKNSYSLLWEIQRDFPTRTPQCPIGVGFLAELYAYYFLTRRFSDQSVRFGSRNQRAWDIEVETRNGRLTHYQVKGVSLFSRSLTFSIDKSCESLIVIITDCELTPVAAHHFPNFRALNSKALRRQLKAPYPNNARRPGSAIFSQSEDILFELLDAVESTRR
jgi:hypothetical protein